METKNVKAAEGKLGVLVVGLGAGREGLIHDGEQDLDARLVLPSLYAVVFLPRDGEDLC